MPETTTAAILNFAKAGASLWGVRGERNRNRKEKKQACVKNKSRV